MKIIEISIHHFFGVTAFKVTKLGKINMIIGENGAGKSTVLMAIREALKSSGVDPDLVQIGEKNAWLFLRFDNGVTIDKTITSTSNNVKVADNGKPISAPQRFLNSFTGQYSFNPVAFFLAKKAERRKLLLSVTPFKLDMATVSETAEDIGEYIDLNQFDFDKHGLDVLSEIQSHVYERRHEQGIIVTRLAKSVEQEERDIPDTGDEIERFKDFDYKIKFDELQVANEAVAEHGRKKEKLNALRQRDVTLQDEIAATKLKLADLEAERLAGLDDGKRLRAEVDLFDVPALAGMRQELNDFQAAQRLFIKLEEIEEKKTNLGKEQLAHKALNLLHEVIKHDLPRRIFQTIKFPIEGLTIEGDDLRANDVAIDKLSTSEKMRFAVQVARALAGELKIICVDGFEALDPKTRAMFVSQAKGDEFEYFIANVGDGPLKMQELETVSASEGDAA